MEFMAMRFVRFVTFINFLCIGIPLFAGQPLQSDTVRVLALRVEFARDNSSTTTGDGTFDLTQSQDPFQIDPPPHDRRYFEDHLLFVNNYFSKVSKGQLFVTGDVFPVPDTAAYRLNSPMAFYNPNTSPEEINTGIARLLKDAVEKADADPQIDFSRYDVVIVFHAGVGKDVDVGFDETPQDIPSLYVTQSFLQTYLGVEGISVENGAVLVTSGIILPETESQAGFQLALNGMVVSNFASYLGWPDLFSPTTLRSGIGRFGVMDAGLFNGDGLLPALPCAWTRIFAGWEIPLEIRQAQAELLTLRHPLSAQGSRVFKFPINEKEYFLVENRYAGELNLDSLQFELARGRNEFPTMKEVLQTYFPDKALFSERGVLINVDNPDRGLPGSGILIWHIDENVIDRNLTANRINADPEHRGVDLEEADGSQDIGQVFDFLSGGAGSEIGTALDFWYQGNPAPLFKNEFSANSIPNSLSYYNRANSHIRLQNFSRPDSVMNFVADLNFFQESFPIKIGVAKYGEVTSLKVADLNNDGRQDLILSTDKNKILAINYLASAAWGDSVEIAGTLGRMNAPPAIFQLIDGTYGIVATDRSGRVYISQFEPENFPGIAALAPFQVPDSISTFPVVVYSEKPTEAPEFPPRIFFGSASGSLYQMKYENTNWLAPEVVLSIPEAIAHIYIADARNIHLIGKSGKAYLNGNLISDIQGDYFPPVGSSLTRVSSRGFMETLGEQKFELAESGIFAADSPPISVFTLERFPREKFIFVGNNRLFLFNFNLTLSENFPVQLNTPARDIRLTIPPLVAPLPDENQETVQGMVVAEPTGVIHAFDFGGNRLPDFPLATGDSITTSPAVLDIDGDGDVELACITRRGNLYVWDFGSSMASAFSESFWTQVWGNEANQNQPGPATGQVEPPLPFQSETSLMPAEKVYNWPNPNAGDFTFIRYWLGQAARVSIKIYDTAGDLVKEMEGPGLAGTDNEVRWDLSGVQSGIYFARIRAKSGSQEATRFIKIAVVK